MQLMNFEERMDRLVERHEALSQSLEIIAGMQQANERAIAKLGEQMDKLGEKLDRLAEVVTNLVQIAMSHERRLDDHDRRLDHPEGGQ